MHQACNYLFFTGSLFEITITEAEFNDFKPRLKSVKNRFQLSAGLNLEKLDTILSEQPYLSRGLNSSSLNSASEYPKAGVNISMFI